MSNIKLEKLIEIHKEDLPIFFNYLTKKSNENSLGYIKSVKIEHWVSKKEWVTFVKEDNINNSFIRTFLNNSATSLKYKASKGAEDAATVIIILIILFVAIPILIPAMTVILFINDLYYSNPFGFIGSYYDWLILNIKLIFAIFGIYL